MKRGFNGEGFLAYLRYRFPDAFANRFTQEMVENLIEYAHQHRHISKDQFCEFLSDFLPEVEMGEVAVFMDDDYLTKTYGIAEKRRVMKEKDIWLKIRNGITHVFIGETEL